jgi:hypothetical protein
MNQPEMFKNYESASAVLAKIAEKYPEDTAEYKTLQQAGFALFFAVVQHGTEFEQFLTEVGQELTPEQKEHLIKLGIRPPL